MRAWNEMMEASKFSDKEGWALLTVGIIRLLELPEHVRRSMFATVKGAEYLEGGIAGLIEAAKARAIAAETPTPDRKAPPGTVNRRGRLPKPEGKPENSH